MQWSIFNVQKALLGMGMLALIFFGLCGCNRQAATEKFKQEISVFLTENRTELEDIAQRCLQQEVPEEDQIYMGHTVSFCDGDHPVIYVGYTISGMIGETTFYDLFYAPDNVPVLPYDTACQLDPIGDDTWIWEDADPGRSGKIIRIEENWFYAEKTYHCS